MSCWLAVTKHKIHIHFSTLGWRVQLMSFIGDENWFNLHCHNCVCVWGGGGGGHGIDLFFMNISDSAVTDGSRCYSPNIAYWWDSHCCRTDWPTALHTTPPTQHPSACLPVDPSRCGVAHNFTNEAHTQFILLDRYSIVSSWSRADRSLATVAYPSIHLISFCTSLSTLTYHYI